jgi:hypothetical protein
MKENERHEAVMSDELWLVFREVDFLVMDIDLMA